MNYKQKKDFVDWLGVMYLDFDNESDEYCKITRKEITDKLETYEK